MKQELWKTVKPGQFLIYASEYEGVLMALVREIDIRIYEPGPPRGWFYPYGLTKETGTVRVMIDSDLRVLNLADLIRPLTLNKAKLEKAWKKYSDDKAEAEESKETFLSLIARLKGE